MNVVASSAQPVSESDAGIARAVEEGHLPSLIAAAAHLSGDLSLLRTGATPVYDAFGDGQGGFAPEMAAKFRTRIIEILKAWRDHGTRAPAPDQAALTEMMGYVAGSAIPERYVPFLEEEMEFSGGDARAPQWGRTVPQSAKKDFRVLVIGAGMSGILAAIRLGQAGVPFVIVERNADVAGTWLVNTYPGCRVDNPNHMYSYSFAPNHDWPQHYSTRAELDAYFRGVAEKFGIRDKVRFGTTVEECVYDETRALWHCRLATGDGGSETLVVNAVITAVGQLREPKLPDIPGIGKFKGPSFHSARWDHDVALEGKRVAVIGTGASAFQFVPEIAREAGHLTVFQRTPPWLAPTADYHEDVTAGQKWLLGHVPFYAQWYRFWLFWTMTDGILPMIKADPEWNGPDEAVSAANEMLRQILAQYTLAQVADRPDLAAAVVPHYPVGGKRSVRDNGVWLDALKRDNVELVTDPIAEITESGLVTKSGRIIDVDVLIYGTGFEASHFLEPMKFKGKGGIDLHEMWDGDARAYLGITVPAFPNLFMMYGPNTNIVVNGSIIFFSECEMNYILGCLELLLAGGKRAMEVKKTVHDAYNERVDAANGQMAWGVPQVSSWYKNAKGRVSQNWPFLLVDYWEATRAPKPEDYLFEGDVALKGAAE